jgi:menaquinone-dependent protoporphyrinogen oxidase
MGRILVLYGTTEGQTARIAESIGATLRAHGAVVDVVHASRGGPSPDEYAGIVIAASVHGGKYQTSVRRWVRAHAHAFGNKPTAFVSVCLGILERDPEVQRQLRAIIARFLEATGWRPATTTIVAGALLYRQYGWLKRWIMKRIVAKAGGDTDTTRDYEYTDWNEVRAFAEEFGERVRASLASEVQPQHARVA